MTDRLHHNDDCDCGEIVFTDPRRNHVVQEFDMSLGQTVETAQMMAVWTIKSLRLKPESSAVDPSPEDMEEVEHMFTLDASLLPTMLADIHQQYGLSFTRAVMLELMGPEAMEYFEVFIQQVQRMRQANNN